MKCIFTELTIYKDRLFIVFTSSQSVLFIRVKPLGVSVETRGIVVPIASEPQPNGLKSTNQNLQQFRVNNPQLLTMRQIALLVMSPMAYNGRHEGSRHLVIRWNLETSKYSGGDGITS